MGTLNCGQRMETIAVENIMSDFLVFLATIDPVGTLALFVGLTAGISAQERTRVAFRAIGYSAVILLVFVFVGQLVLGSLGIRLEAFQLAGGIIFFLFGVQMVFGTGAASADSKSEPGHDVAAFPLAVPSIASPGSILAAVILTDNREFSFGEQAITALLLMAVLGLTLLLLLQANRIYAWIGDAGSALMVRVLGLVLAALAVEMILGAGIELWRETFLEIS
jgi:multiple antibiotic resistance protein